MTDRRSPDSPAAAYSTGGTAWAAGPSRVYAQLADLLVHASPVSLAGRLMCDVGSGTGVASHAAIAAGAHVIATDAAPGMLEVEHMQRPPAVVADATRLPFPDHGFGGVIGAYVYNHLEDPIAGLREARRVTVPGGPLLASTYADDDTHPVKAATEEALREIGWTAPEFYVRMKNDAVPKLATVERAEAAARAAGLRAITVASLRVPFPELTLEDLIAWRLGMAHVAWFVAGLQDAARRAVVARTTALLGTEVPTLVRSVIHITALA